MFIAGIVVAVVAGLICGIMILMAAGIFLMPRMGRFFFVSDRSRLPFDETIEYIRERCKQDSDWIIRGEKDFNKAYQQNGQGKLPHRLFEFKIGNPKHSFRVKHNTPAVCTFMPASIAVVEYEPNKVIVYRKNTSLMGHMFTGSVREIMSKEVPQQLDEMLKDIVEKKLSLRHTIWRVCSNSFIRKNSRLRIKGKPDYESKM
ncbi:MAG: DUF302 domain-containing protein [Phycisphaerae bacterium]|nr:DUF302 domain-containing protein [Phycisphaerae bacterium]